MDCSVVLLVAFLGLLLVAALLSLASGTSSRSARQAPAPGGSTPSGMRERTVRQPVPPSSESPRTSRRAWATSYTIRIDPLSLTEPEEAPSSPQGSSLASLWVPPGQPVQIRDREIRGGMVYVSSTDAPGRRHHLPPEASLIDRGLAVDSRHPAPREADLGYWPTYRELTPGARATYLWWLADGRRDPHTALGYVFLFFYGLERRLLLERPSPDERDRLLDEIEELLTVYGQSRSFRGYGTRLLETIRWREGLFPEHPDLDLDDLATAHEPPFHLKWALGHRVRAKEPIPDELALAWVLSGPFRLRTAPRRCPEAFRELFRIRYREAYPQGGLKVRANKTHLKLEYWPASSTLSRRRLPSRAPEALPDVTVLTAPVQRLQALVDQVSQELDPFSRWVGRTDDRTSPAALALLPAALAGVRESPQSLQLQGWLEGWLEGSSGASDAATLPAAELLERWPTKAPGKITKRETEALMSFCEGRGLGLEPDLRRGGPALHRTGTAVVFRLPDEAPTDAPSSEPSEAYRSAALMLHLAATVSTADGATSAAEEAHLARHLEEGLGLSAQERRRLEAHLVWLLAEPPGFAGVKKAIEPLGGEDRQRLGQFLITVAGSDGHVDADELKILQKIYGLLGLDREAVFSDVHGLMSGGAASVPALPAAGSAPSSGRTTDASPGPEPETFQLDLEKVRRKRQESLEVGGLLHEIFAEEEEPELAATAPEAPEAPAEAGSAPLLLPGLDGPHSRLLERLSTRETWPRIEIERLCSELDLLPDGALEMINEAAYELCGDPLLEGDEVVELDPEILEEMLAEPAG